MLFAWLLIPAIAAVTAKIRGADPRVWQRCSIRDQAKFDSASPDIDTETIHTSSEILCSLLADMREWVELWCHSGDQCTMWGIDALVAGDTEFNSTGGCRKRFAQCDNIFSEGSVRLLEGEGSFERTCTDGYRYTCHPDGIQKVNKTAITPISACGESGFFSSVVGCLRVETTPMTYSAARQSCINFGADLFHHSSPDALAAIRPSFNEYGLQTDVWYGLTKLSGHWVWLNDRPMVPGEFNPNVDFTAYPGELFGKGSPSDDYHVADDWCTVKHPSICIANDLK